MSDSTYIVGIDFGTHQSKICIEKSTNGVFQYEFLEFKDGEKTSVLLPSIIQVNKDNTVSYGYVIPSKAKVEAKEGSIPPTERIVPEPIYDILPKEPKLESLPAKPETKHQGAFAMLAILLPKSEEEKKWELECKTINRANENRKLAWRNQIQIIQQKNADTKKQWEQACAQARHEYLEEFELWQKDVQQCRPLYYRYFKQHYFIGNIAWEESLISSTIACIWYLAYIRLCLNVKIGREYLVRMGVPCCFQNVEEFYEKAYIIWKSACDLADKYKSLEQYLKADYNDLLRNTIIDDKIDEVFPFDVRTEAQAGLYAAVANKRLTNTMNMLIDIGGGTTDIAYFRIKEKVGESELAIDDVVSIPLGLNFIFEQYQKKHPNKTLFQIQDDFSKAQNNDDFKEAIGEYKYQLKLETKGLIRSIYTFLRQITGNKHIHKKMETCPLVFCGGGSLYNSMLIEHFTYEDTNGSLNYQHPWFRSRYHIDKSTIGIQNVINENIADKLYTMLATSYGLSLADNWQETGGESVRNKPKGAVYRPQQVYFDERNDDD